MMTTIDAQEETRERLLNTVKKEVKQLMEFSVSCKFIHEDNCCISSLCAAVDACLLHGLKPDLILNKRSSYQLVKKIAKDHGPARGIVEICDGLSEELAHKSSRFGIDKIFSHHDNGRGQNWVLTKNYQSLFNSNLSNLKLFWLKVALIEKKIDSIVEEIQKSAHKFYYQYSLMSDPVLGPMVAELLAGPCALEYTRIKTCDALLTDQNADELIRRHKMHSQLMGGAQTHGVKPWIAERSGVGVGPTSWGCLSPVRSPARPLRATVAPNPAVNSYNPKEYVESLHQNLKTHLIYAKNHVFVNKRNSSIAGYLSLHQGQSGLILNWTPNDLLNTSSANTSISTCMKDIIHIELDKISYVCCNLRLDLDSIIIFVAHDGVQYPSFVFPLGTHLIQFLNCLENAILPAQRFEPVGWEDLLVSSPEPFILKKTLFEIEPTIDNLELTMDHGNIHGLESPRSVTPRAEKRLKLKNVCDDMRYRIMSRAFYGWYKHCQQAKTLKKHLFKMIIPQVTDAESVSSPTDSLIVEYIDQNRQLDESLWTSLLTDGFNQNLFYKLVYSNGVENNDLRRRVWPYLLGVLGFEMTKEEVDSKLRDIREGYNRVMSEWQPVETYVREREEKSLNESSITPIKSSPIDEDSGVGSDFTRSSSSSSSSIGGFAGKLGRKNSHSAATPIRSSLSSTRKSEKGKISKSKPKIRWSSPIATRPASIHDVSHDLDLSSILIKAHKTIKNKLNAKNFFSKIMSPKKAPKPEPRSDQKPHPDLICQELAQLLVANAIMRARYELEKEDEGFILNENKSITFYSPIPDQTSDNLGLSQSINNQSSIVNTSSSSSYHSSPFLQLESTQNSHGMMKRRRRGHDESQQCLSPILDDLLSNKDVVDAFAANMHRIDKDVLRCDRNFSYFMTKENLEKLKNIIYTYIWETLDIGYVQGMCDLIAPFLVLFDDEPLAFECFKKIMEKLEKNFLSSSEMDRQFEEMSFLVQILDTELHEYMQARGDHTQFYFTYRWFLLEFKREFSYEEVFSVWETLWAARHTTTEHFHLFIALALVEAYRDIILENQMDFTNIIKFFNEMTEKHGGKEILTSARKLVDTLANIVFDRN